MSYTGTLNTFTIYVYKSYCTFYPACVVTAIPTITITPPRKIKRENLWNVYLWHVILNLVDRCDQ